MRDQLFLLFTSVPAWAGYLWLGASLALLLVEVATPGLFVFVAFAAGCALAAPVAFMAYSPAIQWSVALAGSLFSFFLIRYFFAVRARGTSHEPTNYSAIIGKTGVVLSVNATGQQATVKIGGEIWSARLEGEGRLEPNSHVLVKTLVGNHVQVKPL